MYLANSVPYNIFFIVFIFLFALANSKYGYLETKKTVNIFSLYVVFFAGLLFIGCRGYICADWLFYEPFFSNSPTLFSSKLEIQKFISHSMFEKGFSFYVMIIRTFSDNYLLLQFISFCIDVIILHFFFKEYCSNNYFLCWCFYWIFQGYVFEIIILRNTKAILLFLISIKHIEKKQPLKFFLLNYLGFLFHTSAFLYFPLYFLGRLKRRKLVELSLFIMGNFIFLGHISFVKNILMSFLPIFSGRLASMLNIYLSSEKFSSAQGLSIGYLERTFSFFLLFKYSGSLIKEHNYNRIFWNLFLIYSFIYLYLSEMSILIERIPNLFVCSYWILYPQIYKKLSKEKKYIFLVVLIFYGILKTMMLMNMKSSYYDNFLFGMLDKETRKQFFTY